jgi:hypothetical protein
VEEDAIRAVVDRLARTHPSGGQVIERAAILAEGTDAQAVIAWIVAHAGVPEGPAPANRNRGLHGSRLTHVGAADAKTPLRYVLPAGTLS